MRKIFLLLASIILYACSLPMQHNNYIPQNYTRITGKIEIGEFSYIPYELFLVQKNQIRLLASSMPITLTTDVSDFIKRANALEFEKTGIISSNDAKYKLEADIEDLTCINQSFSECRWIYKITYKFINKETNSISYEKKYSIKPYSSPGLSTTLSQPQVLNEIILTGYNLMINDPEVQKLFKK